MFRYRWLCSASSLNHAHTWANTTANTRRPHHPATSLSCPADSQIGLSRNNTRIVDAYAITDIGVMSGGKGVGGAFAKCDGVLAAIGQQNMPQIQRVAFCLPFFAYNSWVAGGAHTRTIPSIVPYTILIPEGPREDTAMLSIPLGFRRYLCPRRTPRPTTPTRF